MRLINKRLVQNLKLMAIVLLLVSLMKVGTENQPSKVQAARQDQTQAASASPVLFGATGGGEGNGPSNLYKIDSLSGAATFVGPIGFKSVSAMDCHPFTGILYATGRRATGGTLVLITINPLTGAGTEVGPLASGFNVQDMSFRNSDAVLFAYRSTLLIKIDISTGAQTIVGRTFSLQDGNGLAFSLNDTLYHAAQAPSQLAIFDQTTGARTVINTLKYPPGLGGEPRVSAMDFQPGTSDFYCTIITNEGSPAYLGTINTTTGDVTVIGRTADRMDALAWLSSPPFNICLQDETNNSLLQIDSTTGNYRFTNCQGFMIGGTGTITTRGCLVTLQVDGPDRRLLARIDTCLKSGTGYIQVLSTGRNFSILDRNTSNNGCSCPGG